MRSIPKSLWVVIVGIGCNQLALNGLGFIRGMANEGWINPISMPAFLTILSPVAEEICKAFGLFYWLPKVKLTESDVYRRAPIFGLSYGLLEDYLHWHYYWRTGKLATLVGVVGPVGSLLLHVVLALLMVQLNAKRPMWMIIVLCVLLHAAFNAEIVFVSPLLPSAFSSIEIVTIVGFILASLLVALAFRSRDPRLSQAA